MPAHHYINLLFESLENAVVYGVIKAWSIDGANITIQRDGRWTSLSQLDAANYLIHLLEEQESQSHHGEAATSTYQASRSVG